MSLSIMAARSGTVYAGGGPVFSDYTHIESGSTYAPGGPKTVSCTRPASTATGDLLVAAVGTNTSSSSVGDVATPAGWTLVAGPLGREYRFNHYVFTRVAGVSEPGSYDFVASYNVDKVHVAIALYTGPFVGTVLEGAGGVFRDYAGGSNNTIQAPSVTHAGAASGTRLVTFEADSSGSAFSLALSDGPLVVIGMYNYGSPVSAAGMTTRVVFPYSEAYGVPSIAFFDQP